MEQFEFHAATTSHNRQWTPLEPGVDELVLNHDSQTGRRTTLQRWQPGARNRQHVFVHDYVEEIFMVEGDLYDLNLEEGWEKGAYAYRKPGMRHGPFRSETGCLMFIVCIPAGEEGNETACRDANETKQGFGPKTGLPLSGLR